MGRFVELYIYPRDPVVPYLLRYGDVFDTLMWVLRVQSYLLRFGTTGSLGKALNPFLKPNMDIP